MTGSLPAAGNPGRLPAGIVRRLSIARHARPGARPGRRGWLAVLVALSLLALPGAGAWGFDRANVPLKNWGGFALYRDQVYDDLERLVTAGLAGRTLLSTKPLSRIEAARIVARAVESIRRDDHGLYNGRRDLEPVLDRLMIEFATELAALGIRIGDSGPPPGSSTFTPVDRAQARLGYASEARRFVNTQGLRFDDGLNAGLTFESRAQVGDVLSLYLQPEFVGTEDYGKLKLATGYAKLTLFNVELLVGRDSLWWGPGLHGSLAVSDNAPALDQIRIGSAEPFLLPLVGQWIGPTKLLFFVAQLEESRADDPRARLAGMRATIAPFSFLELGASRLMMFGGENEPRPSFGDFVKLLVDPPAGDPVFGDESQRSNNVFAIDMDLRIPNVRRWMLPMRDLRLYGEFGWDDTCCETATIPLREAISFLAGLHAIGLFGQEGLDARFEYANSSSKSFTHFQFTEGYRTRGSVISHFIGTAGENYYSRVTNRLTPNAMLGLELDRGVIGSTTHSFRGPKERYVAGAIDISYRFSETLALFAQYRLGHTENRDFVRGDNGFDHLLRFELTRSFR
jgi:hypothetical protein